MARLRMIDLFSGIGGFSLAAPHQARPGKMRLGLVMQLRPTPGDR